MTQATATAPICPTYYFSADGGPGIGNICHRIRLPDSGQRPPSDFESFYDGMASAFNHLLKVHPDSKDRPHDLIILAFKDFMLEVAPRFQKPRYQTYRAGGWDFSSWLIDRMKYFLADSSKLGRAMAKADDARAKADKARQDEERQSQSRASSSADILQFRARPKPTEEYHPPEDLDLADFVVNG
jgi:hypothetical protein